MLGRGVVVVLIKVFTTHCLFFNHVQLRLGCPGSFPVPTSWSPGHGYRQLGAVALVFLHSSLAAEVCSSSTCLPTNHAHHLGNSLLLAWEPGLCKLGRCSQLGFLFFGGSTYVHVIYVFSSICFLTFFPFTNSYGEAPWHSRSSTSSAVM